MSELVNLHREMQGISAKLENLRDIKRTNLRLLQKYGVKDIKGAKAMIATLSGNLKEIEKEKKRIQERADQILDGIQEVLYE